MKRLEVGDKVVLNKDSYWVRQQLKARHLCPLDGVLTVTLAGQSLIKIGRNCLYLERASFALVNNVGEQ